VLLQKKIEKLVHLFGFTIEIYHDARPYKRQIYWGKSPTQMQSATPQMHERTVKVQLPHQESIIFSKHLQKQLDSAMSVT